MIIKIVLGKTKYTVCQKRANRVNKLYIKCNNKILIKTLTKGKEEKISSCTLLKLIVKLLHKYRRKKKAFMNQKKSDQDGAVTR